MWYVKEGPSAMASGLIIYLVSDIPSHVYQFTFANNPFWSRFYARGGEIQEYLKDVAWKYDVERYVRFRHLFQRAEWHEETQQWHLTIKDLETGQVGQRYSRANRGLLRLPEAENRPSRYFAQRYWIA